MSQLDIPKLIASELSIQTVRVQNALNLLAEGATIPFIARYRKEKTESLDEVQLRSIQDRYNYLIELEQRKSTILEAIATQNKLTEDLKVKIQSCLLKNELEDLYLPYKPKRRTKATIAREKGLEPLANLIKSLNSPHVLPLNIEQEANQYISPEKDVKTVDEALQGASDILAEEIAEKANLRAYLRDYLLKDGVFVSQIKNTHPEGSTKYEMYRNFKISLAKAAPHHILALFRGESEDILSVDIDFDESTVINYLTSQEIKTKTSQLKEFYRKMLGDSFNRLIKPSLMREIRLLKKQWADLESITTFEENLRNLLLSSPAGMKPTLAVDPGFRTGCKVAILSETGQFLEYQTIFPFGSEKQLQEAKDVIKKLIQKHQIQLIAIGNGTASRETDQFMSEILKNLEQKPIKVTVNESGASIYSASDVAREEFPNLDLTIRGAISIGRRLQDPLAELVKIEPKSIGVGQYQHDVDQKLLKKKLDETVESCVNYVGVDLNTASKELLTFVSGINSTVANNIVTYRNEIGKFENRKELLKVPKLGAKAFEQAAGFLRIRDGENPLDNTAVHPESYKTVEAIASFLNIPISQISQKNHHLKTLDLKQFVSDKVGLPTLKDVIQELEKPGRDPREEFKYATFEAEIKEITDLKEGLILEGVITNVVNFGAFVDIGVHQDGLVHISQLANQFVSDPKQIVKVGQVVKVKVMEVNEKLKRISLSMKDV
ncbi:RNA-binding transcriptional accessory protein [Aphanothece hegewaldii CCALA 016]|uniref:RNA-binding transcriptional accessory protein n=1 Tax=Aphanothece hegewaldii CCALA 016 TaxID=2107694 RepID=A0A2T1M3N8_9CHRO|nr:Tex family protein [Aphanothece hegewaldii]PSF39370.1 RNA-binding transcriptional accessory protein [Aphanothece hegewaldii CCALA 016]